MSNKSLSWNDRFALIDHFGPNDNAICSAFGVTIDELNTAREMRNSGAFVPTTNLDVDAYANVFDGESSKQRSSVTSTTRPKSTKTASPITATKKVKEPQKRGRKGDKIIKAFTAVPVSPTPVEQFAKEYGVSVAVLRQSKRFDKNPELGEIRVKMDKSTKTLMIWREKGENLSA